MGSSERPLSIYSSLMVISTIIGYFGVSDADVLLRDSSAAATSTVADSSNGLLLRSKFEEREREAETELDEEQHPFRRYTINNDKKMKLLTQKSKDGRNESVTLDESMWEQLVIRALANPTEWVQLRQALDKVDADLRALTSMENSKQNQSKSAPKWKFTYHRVTSPQFTSPNLTRGADGSLIKGAGLGKAKAFAAISIPHSQSSKDSKLDSHSQHEIENEHLSQRQSGSHNMLDLDNSLSQYQHPHQNQQYLHSPQQQPPQPPTSLLKQLKSQDRNINYVNMNVPFDEGEVSNLRATKGNQIQRQSQASLVGKNKINWKLKGGESDADDSGEDQDEDGDENDDDDDEDEDDSIEVGAGRVYHSVNRDRGQEVARIGAGTKKTKGGKQMRSGNISSQSQSHSHPNPNPHKTLPSKSNTFTSNNAYSKYSPHASESSHVHGRSRSQLEQEIAKMSSLSKAKTSSNDNLPKMALHGSPTFHWKPLMHHKDHSATKSVSKITTSKSQSRSSSSVSADLDLNILHKSELTMDDHISPNPEAAKSNKMETLTRSKSKSRVTTIKLHPHPASLTPDPVPINLNDRDESERVESKPKLTWSETLRNFHDQVHAASRVRSRGIGDSKEHGGSPHHHHHHRYYFHPHPPSAFKLDGLELELDTELKTDININADDDSRDSNSNNKGGNGQKIPSSPSKEQTKPNQRDVSHSSPSASKIEHEKKINVQFLDWSGISKEIGNDPRLNHEIEILNERAILDSNSNNQDNQYHWRQRHQRRPQKGEKAHPLLPPTPPQPAPAQQQHEPLLQQQKPKQLDELEHSEIPFSGGEMDTVYEADRDRIFSSLSRRSTSLEYKI